MPSSVAIASNSLIPAVRWNAVRQLKIKSQSDPEGIPERSSRKHLS